MPQNPAKAYDLFERAPPYLCGGPFSTCPFSIMAASGKSPLSVLATLDKGPLVYDLFDELEPVLGLGTGEDEGGFPPAPCLGSIGGEYDPPLCLADEDGLLGGVGGTTAMGLCLTSFSVGEGMSSSIMCTVIPSSAA